MVSEFEGATKITKGEGSKKLLRTLATSSNLEASTEDKFNSRRIAIVKSFPSYKKPANNFKALADQVFLKNFLASPEKPLDALVRSSKNWIKLVPIPPQFESEDLASLSPDGKRVSQYILWVVETIEELQKYAPSATFRDLQCHATFFMAPKLLDQITENLPESLWRRQGGAEAYYRTYLPHFFKDKSLGVAPETRSPMQLLSQLIQDVGTYASYRAETSGSASVGVELEDVRIINPTGQQLSLWIRSDADLQVQPFKTEVTLKSVEPVFRSRGLGNKNATVRGGSRKGWSLPLFTLAADDIRILLKTLCRPNLKKEVAALLHSIGRVETSIADPLETVNRPSGSQSNADQRAAELPRSSELSISMEGNGPAESTAVELDLHISHIDDTFDESVHAAYKKLTKKVVGGGNKRSHHVLLDQLNPEVQKHMEVAASAAALEAPAISKETSRRGREKYREEEAVKEKQSESMAICSQSEPTEERASRVEKDPRKRARLQGFV